MTFEKEPSSFYKSYVEDIKRVISRNAAAEFEAINKEFARHKGRVPRALISDQMATALIELQDELEASGLYADESTKKVLEGAFPSTLVAKVGLETLLKRLPEAVSTIIAIAFPIPSLPP